MDKEGWSTFLLFLVTILRIHPAENASSLVAIVRLLSSVEPFVESSSRGGSRREGMCTCHSAPHSSRDIYDIPDLMKDIHRLRQRGIRVETIMEAVKLSLADSYHSGLGSFDISHRTKHTDRQKSLMETLELGEDLNNNIYQNPLGKNKEFQENVPVPSGNSDGNFVGAETGLKDMTVKDDYHPRQMHPHTPNAFPLSELTSTKLFSIQGQIQSRKSLPYSANAQPPAGVTVIADSGVPGKIITVQIALEPGMTLHKVLMQAEIEYDYDYNPDYENPLHVIARRSSWSHCSEILEVGGQPSTSAHQWVALVYDANNQEIYRSKCIDVPRRELHIGSGFTIRLQYEQVAKAKQIQ